LPELLEQVGCEQNRYHAYDVWTHTMRCVDECDGGPMVRLAALLHDLGKPRARVWSEDKADYTFLHHERIGAEMADRWMRDYRFSNAEREQVTHLVRHHLVAHSSEWSDAAVRRFVRRVGADHIPDLLTLARADTRAKGLPVDDRLAAFDELERRVADVQRQGVPLSQGDLAVSGKDLITELGLAPGPRIGQVLRALTEEVVDDPSLNARDRLLERARALIDADERRGAGAGTGGRPSTEDGHEDGAAGAASPAERAEEAGGEP
jgi:tRNA nucleotidyltransferase (CCA-adding enzyme)